MLLFPSLSMCVEKTSWAQTAAAQKKPATGLISHAEELLLLLWQSRKFSFLWHYYQLMLFVYNHPGASAWVWSLMSSQCKLGIWWLRSSGKPIIDLIFNGRLPVHALLLLSSQNPTTQEWTRKKDYGLCYWSPNYGYNYPVTPFVHLNCLYSL